MAAGFYDEMYDSKGVVRAHYREFARWLESMPPRFVASADARPVGLRQPLGDFIGRRELIRFPRFCRIGHERVDGEDEGRDGNEDARESFHGSR